MILQSIHLKPSFPEGLPQLIQIPFCNCFCLYITLILLRFFLIQEIQYVYSSQGQPLNNKHIEIIVKQMFSKLMIEFSGDTMLSPGEIVDRNDLIEENLKAKNEGKQGAYGLPVLLGITKSSLSTQSFLSAASFQETTRVLIDAAVTGKIDHLRGLKENVIIGRLIPSGTGFKKEGEEKKTESK